jgi:hypothetical protein
MVLYHRVIQAGSQGQWVGRCRIGLPLGSGHPCGDVDQVTVQGRPARGRAQQVMRPF